MMPTRFLELEEREKAFVIAAIKIKLDNDKKREKELKKKRAGRKGR